MRRVSKDGVLTATLVKRGTIAQVAHQGSPAGSVTELLSQLFSEMMSASGKISDTDSTQLINYTTQSANSQPLQDSNSSRPSDEFTFHIVRILLTYSGPAAGIANLPSQRIPAQQIGLACSNAKVGDAVYQFYGSDICIVVRPKGDSYELIGRAAVTKQGLGRGREDESNHFTGKLYQFSA